MKRVPCWLTVALLPLTAPLEGLDPRLAAVNDWDYGLRLDVGVTIDGIAATDFSSSQLIFICQ